MIINYRKFKSILKLINIDVNNVIYHIFILQLFHKADVIVLINY